MDNDSSKVCRGSFDSNENLKNEINIIIGSNGNNNNKHFLKNSKSPNYIVCFSSGNIKRKKIIKEKNILNTSPSKIIQSQKSNRVNNINVTQLDLIQKNKYYNDISKRINTDNCISNHDNPIEKRNNINKNILINGKKEILSLNKRVKRERYIKSKYIILPANNSKKEENRPISFNYFSNKNNNQFKENNDQKKVMFNYSQGNMQKSLSFKEQEKNDELNNNNYSNPFNDIHKKYKKRYVYNQYYTNIDISSFNQNNEIFDEPKIMKKEIYLNNPSKNDFIINTYIYNTPIEQHNIFNNKNYITTKKNQSLLNKGKSISKENILISKNGKNNNINEKLKNFIPFNKIKFVQVNKKLPEINNKSSKRNENCDNIKFSKDISNDVSNNYQIKKNTRTERITLEDNDIMNKIEKIPIYSNNTKKSLKKKKKKKYKNNNKDAKLNYQKLFLNKIEKNKEELNSEEIDELKISRIRANKKIILHGSYSSSIIDYPYRNKIGNTQCNTCYLNSKTNGNKYINNDIKTVCLIDPRKNSNNNQIKISNNHSYNNINESNKDNKGKVYKDHKVIISRTKSGKKNYIDSIMEDSNINKFEIPNLKNSPNKKHIIFLNDSDNIKNFENNSIQKIKLIKKKNRGNEKLYMDNCMDNIIQNDNKSIVNIQSNAPNTLFKSIKIGKNIKSEKKIKKTKRENEIDDELKSFNITAKKFCYYNIKNKDANKSNLTKENKFKEMNIKNNCVNINLDEGINKDKNEVLKTKKMLINNYSENYILEKNKNNYMYQDKKSIKNDINNIKANMDIDGLKMNKYISQINTLEEIKNTIVYELNTESNRKLNSSKNKNKCKPILTKIYIKPSCHSPGNNKQSQMKVKLNLQKNSPSRNNNINHLFLSNKNIYPNSSTKLKKNKSSDLLKISIKKNVSEYNKIVTNDDIIDENKIRENYVKKYCFFQKYNDYFLRRPLIYECYIQKLIQKNIQQINSDYFSKSRYEIDNKENKDYDSNNENDFNKTCSFKNITFADNKNIITKVNSLKNENNGDNIKKDNKEINKEMNKDIQEKSDINKKHQQVEILDDNFLDNEDIKLNYSDDNFSEDNSIKLYGTTLGKEIEDSEKKICKTYKNIKHDSNILENAEKGLKILRNIAERREIKNKEESNNIIKDNNSNENENVKNKVNTNKKIFLGTNKLNILFNNRRQSIRYLTDGNNEYKDLTKNSKYRFSKSLNKDSLLKGISKIENLFEKKSNQQEKSRIKTYQKKRKEKDMNIYCYTESKNDKSIDNKDIIPNINIIKNESTDEYSESYLLLNNNFLNDNKDNNHLNMKLDDLSARNELLKNSVKYEIIYLLNLMTERNYLNISDKLIETILYINGKIDDTIIINNENMFKDIIFDKLFAEPKYIKLYSRLIKDLNDKIQNVLKEKKNIKINKERTLKFIINEECINILNKYKNIPNEINLEDYNSDNYFILRNNFRAYVTFIYEFINIELLKPQFGTNIIEQFYKKTRENIINIIYKTLYLDSCIILFDKLVEDIFKDQNNKLIQCLNNFIDNLSKEDNQEFPDYLKYKIINSIEKGKKISKKNYKYQNLFGKALEEEINNKVTFSQITINQNNIKNNSNDDYKLIIQEDLINYIEYFTEKGNNNQTIIKKEVDKSYNWKVIDDLINEKTHGLSFIINKFIQICAEIIIKESQVLLANDYIKNIIEYYINNLSKEEKEKIQDEMIKSFQNINDIINKNQFMCKILGNLLFILIENKLYYIKDFNKYLNDQKTTKINLAIITKYCIISSGKFAKKYFNDFKQTKLFINNNNIFNEYVYNTLKDLFYFFK